MDEYYGMSLRSQMNIAHRSEKIVIVDDLDEEDDPWSEQILDEEKGFVTSIRGSEDEDDDALDIFEKKIEEEKSEELMVKKQFLKMLRNVSRQRGIEMMRGFNRSDEKENYIPAEYSLNYVGIKLRENYELNSRRFKECLIVRFNFSKQEAKRICKRIK